MTNSSKKISSLLGPTNTGKTFEAIDIDTRLEESQIIRSNSTGLVLYSPENVASRIAERRKAKLTREEKIALFKEQQSSVMN